MHNYGLIGQSLSHSFSPGYFSKKFEELCLEDCVYRTHELHNIAEFPALLQQETFSGLNVTIPYKESIVSYLDELDPIAEDLGAVNTICFRDGKTKGYNTDWIGFKDSLAPLLKEHHQKALVLGTGGAAKAVIYALNTLGISYQEISRSEKTTLSYADLDGVTIKEHLLIINTTPLGMHPNTDQYPQLPYSAIGKDHLVYDLIYNPAETRFLQQAKARGAAIKNGLEMLQLQAEGAWKLWNAKPIG